MKMFCIYFVLGVFLSSAIAIAGRSLGFNPFDVGWFGGAVAGNLGLLAAQNLSRGAA